MTHTELQQLKDDTLYKWKRWEITEEDKNKSDEWNEKEYREQFNVVL